MGEDKRIRKSKAALKEALLTLMKKKISIKYRLRSCVGWRG